MTNIEQNRMLRRPITVLLIVALLASLWTGYSVAVKAEEAPVLPTFNIPALSEEHRTSPLPNVIVVATGGTLAGRASNSTSFQSYSAGVHPVSKLLNEIPKHKNADVTGYQFGNKGSGGYTFAELYDLSLAVDAALEIYDSAVVTTGTDTMEEIAYFLDLTVRSDKPVVVTGAMRPWDVIGTDGPANLYQAIKVAASNKTKYFGTVVMLNDVIHAAREVTKANSHRMDTFDTPMLGALGYVDDSAVRIYRLNARAMKAGKADWGTPFDLRTISKTKLPVVGIAYNYQEATGGAIRGLVNDGAKGIVTAGTGAGGISSEMSAARTRAMQDQGVVFVSTTRTGSGSVGGGSGNIIAGDNLNPQHARIMLMLSLAFTDDVSTMRGWFQTVGTQDFSISDDRAPFWEVGGRLTGSAITQSGVTLNWPRAKDDMNVVEYVVYRAGQEEAIATLSADTLSYQVTGLRYSTSYDFTVVARDAMGNESAALSASFVTLAIHAPIDGGSGGVVPSEGKATIPAGGSGTVSLEGLVTVTVPSGATNAQMELEVRKVLDTAGLVTANDTLVSSIFEITKSTSGNFLTPVSLSFKFDPSLIGEGKMASVFWYDEQAKRWVEVGGTVSGDIITASVDHFTKFAVFAVDAEEPEQPGEPEGPQGPEVPEVPVNFTDISGHWAEATIRAAASAGIVKGYEDGTFRPGNTVTRAEFAVMLIGALGTEGSAGTLSFNDRDRIPAWAAPSIAEAVRAGIVSGYPDGTFRPSSNITRMEMAAMIASAKGLDTSSGAATAFADNGEIPAWAQGAVKAVYDAGIVQGRPGNLFAPRATATRADSITMIMNMLDRRS